MTGDIDHFEHTHESSSVLYGPGCVEQLSTKLDSDGCERVLVVTGKTVGANDAVMDPIRDGLGRLLAGVFDETTPAKSAATARDGIGRMEAVGADALLAVGGGSSIDVARAISVFEAEDRPAASLFSEVLPNGEIRTPEMQAPKTPVYTVPTTLSGAELTCAAGINLDEHAGGEKGDIRAAPIFDPKITPEANFYDPTLLASTPDGVVARSGMNGFNHGVEAIYSRNANPVTDASASHGLNILRETLPELGDNPNVEMLGRAQVGVALTSQGLIDPESNANKYNLIHAFGHILSRFYDIQQGAVHGIVTPHVLAFVFESVDGRRRLLGEALSVAVDRMDKEAVAAGVIESVADVRDGLGLPTRLRDVPELHRDDLPELADAITEDVGLLNNPPGLDPTAEELLGVLEAAW